MSRIFNDYMVGAEREAAIEEAYFDNMFSKLETMYEMVSMQYDQMVRDAEYKVFSESGTYDDLAYFMEEAAAETGENKQNILQKLIDGIKTFIGKIIDGIKGLFGKGAPDDEIEVDTGVMAATKQVSSKAQELMSAFKNSNVAQALVAVGGIVGTGFVLNKTGATEKIKRSALESDIDVVRKVAEAVQGFSDKVSGWINTLTGKNDEQDNANKGLGIVRKFTSFLSNIATNLKSAIGGAVNKITGKDGEAQNNAQANDKQAKNIADRKFAGQNNGVTVTGKQPDGYTYRVDRTTGKVTRVKKGVEEDVAEGNLPENIKKLAQQAKGKAAMANQANQQANQQRQFDQQLNGQKPTNKKFNIRIDNNTGKIYATADGKTQEVTSGNIMQYIPDQRARKSIILKSKKIRDQLRAKGKVQESVEFDDLYSEFKDELDIITALESEGYIVDFDSDSYIIESVALPEDDEIEHPEEYVESKAQSIFGYDFNESVMESTDFDKELEELANIFADI